MLQEFDGALDCISLAVTCAFNKRGTLLAVGCNDGRIVIWDFLTRGIAKIISAHVHPVCSLRLVWVSEQVVYMSPELCYRCDNKYCGISLYYSDWLFIRLLLLAFFMSLNSRSYLDYEAKCL